MPSSSAATRDRRRLGEILVATGALSAQQLEHALAEQAKLQLPLGQTLLKLNYTTDEMMRQALSSQLGIPYIDLRNVIIDRSLRGLIDPEYARRHALFPVARIGQTLTIAMDDPTARTIVEELEHQTGHAVSVVTSPAQAIQQALRRMYDGAEKPHGGRPAAPPARPTTSAPPARDAAGDAQPPYPALLGLTSTGVKGLLAAVDRGLPYRAFDQLVKHTGLTAEQAANFADIPRRTLPRRKTSGRFTRDESDRLIRCARVFAEAVRAFKGDRTVAVAWLLSEQPALEGRIPLEMARTDLGGREVEAAISRLKPA